MQVNICARAGAVVGAPEILYYVFQDYQACDKADNLAILNVRICFWSIELLTFRFPSQWQFERQ